MKKIRLLIIFISMIEICLSQNTLIDSSIVLNEINIISNRITNFSRGYKFLEFDSLSMLKYNSQNLSDLLQHESPLYIKSYGNGSLSTSSFRGSSASHTAILWNGFNINSCLNGQVDLSQIPISSTDNIKIQFGSSSALWGSGCIGGAVLINSNPIFDNGIIASTSLSIGSFNKLQQFANVSISKKKFITSLKIYNNQSNNDFEYYDVYKNEYLKLKNSRYSLKGFLNENFLKISDKQTLNLFVWFQSSDREIPPTIFQNDSKSKQYDNFFRVSSEWKYLHNKTIFYIRNAYFDEKQKYFDGNFNKNYLNNSNSIIDELELKHQLNSNNNINLGLNNTLCLSNSDNLTNFKTQNRFSVFGSYSNNLFKDRLKSTLSIRQEFITNQNIPLTYSIGSEYIFNKLLTFKANFAKSHRLPTLNDLYWQPGGNHNLLSESGYSQEFSIRMNILEKNNKFFINFEPTIFNRNIDNWIIWLPTNEYYWAPKNSMEVMSRGFETQTELSIHLKAHRIKFICNTNYTISTNEKSKSENDLSVGKQLIYTPIYNGFATINYEYNNFIISYNHSYTGYRYTTTDNSEFLEPYNIGNMYLSYNRKYKNYKFDIYFKINNLWNERYEIVLNRPMALRNLEIGLKIKYHNKH